MPFLKTSIGGRGVVGGGVGVTDEVVILGNTGVDVVVITVVVNWEVVVSLVAGVFSRVVDEVGIKEYVGVKMIVSDTALVSVVAGDVPAALGLHPKNRVIIRVSTTRTLRFILSPASFSDSCGY
jgi:hypothetical protein